MSKQTAAAPIVRTSQEARDRMAADVAGAQRIHDRVAAESGIASIEAAARTLRHAQHWLKQAEAILAQAVANLEALEAAEAAAETERPTGWTALADVRVEDSVEAAVTVRSTTSTSGTASRTITGDVERITVRGGRITLHVTDENGTTHRVSGAPDFTVWLHA